MARRDDKDGGGGAEIAPGKKVPGDGAGDGGEEEAPDGLGPEDEQSPDEYAKVVFATDRRTVYKPLLRHLRAINKGAKALERDVPMGKLARMQVDGLFLPVRHEPLYRDVREVLKTSKDYVERYWRLQQKIAREFDSQMERDGIFTTENKGYKSLRNTLPDAVILGRDKEWPMSYDTYVPRLRETARPTESRPRDGREFYADMVELFGQELTGLKKDQRKLVRLTGALSKKVRAIRWNSPEYQPGL